MILVSKLNTSNNAFQLNIKYEKSIKSVKQFQA